MELTQLQKIKSLLPVEVTAAFIALQSIINGKEIQGAPGTFEGSNDHHLTMGILLVVLAIANTVLLRRGGITDTFSLAFSTLGFCVWAVNLDAVRWQDKISQLGVSPDASQILLPVLAILYSLATAIVATNTKK